VTAGKKRHVARSVEDKAIKRDLILDAAMRLLVGRGYLKATMSDVAAEAGVGRGTVYWHFASKDDLFFCLLEREVSRFDVGFAELMGVDAPAIARLESLVRASFAFYSEAPNLFQAFLSVLAGADEAMQARIFVLFSRMYGRYDDMIEELLDRAKDEGDVRRDLDSRVVAAAIVVMLDAMFLQISFGLVDNEPERLAAGILSLLRRGYLADPGDEGGTA
jgi:AcrR family transcriptional regulator